MKPRVLAILVWTPRVLGILFILFLSLFALDIFGQGYSFWETVLGLTMHLLPSIALSLALVLAWRRPWTGALGFILIVDPDLQNRGIGTAVMHALEKRYADAVDRYALSTGHRSARNLHLYRKLGYRETGRSPLNENCELVLMEKSVAR